MESGSGPSIASTEVVEILGGREVVIGEVGYGGIAQPTSRTEDPMTDDRMALIELLQKSGEDDFLRSVAEAVLQLLMEADVEGLIGAGRHERSADRLNYRRYHGARGEIGRPARRQSWIRAKVPASVAQPLPFLSLSS